MIFSVVVEIAWISSYILHIRGLGDLTELAVSAISSWHLSLSPALLGLSFNTFPVHPVMSSSHLLLYLPLFLFPWSYVRLKKKNLTLTFTITILYLYSDFPLHRFFESHWFTWVTQMSHLPNDVARDTETMDWMTMQLKTTCNVDPGVFNDWFTGHLNYQIEHQ